MATKPTSQRLTLEHAIEATRNPIKREGDLVFVQKDPRFGNLYSGMTDLAGNEFPAGEMRSMYMPSMDRSIREFDRPATENQLRTLYAEGGYLESLEHFTDEALAMYYGYMAGTVTESGLAGNVGDPGQFEADVQEALSRRPEVRPDDLRLIKQDILALHKKYKLSANVGEKSRNGYKKRDDYEDRMEFARIVQKIHLGYKTIPAIIDAPELKSYKSRYPGRETLRGWIKKALPDRVFKSGRPRKA